MWDWFGGVRRANCVKEPRFQNYCKHTVFFVLNSAIYLYFSDDIWAHIRTDCFVGLYCYVINEFHKPKLELCTILHQDCFIDESDMWPLVHLWPQQLSYHYSSSLYLCSLMALLPLIISQWDESGRSLYHADLVLNLNIYCCHPRRTDCSCSHIICYKVINMFATWCWRLKLCSCVTSSTFPSLHFSIHSRHKHVVFFPQ